MVSNLEGSSEVTGGTGGGVGGLAVEVVSFLAHGGLLPNPFRSGSGVVPCLILGFHWCRKDCSRSDLVLASCTCHLRVFCICVDVSYGDVRIVGLESADKCIAYLMNS